MTLGCGLIIGTHVGFSSIHSDIVSDRYDAGLNRLTKVDRFVVNGSWRPFPTRSSDLREVGATLHTIELQNQEDKDKVVWIVEPSGNYSTTLAWKIIRRHGTMVDWASIVWCKQSIPKHNFITWRVCKGRLPTQSHLCKLGILNTSQCFFCWNNSETLEHLFFECPFSKGV